MCDAICVSDHRPVNAALELLVDESVKGFRVEDKAGFEDGPPVNPINHYPLHNACFYHFRVTCVSFDLETPASQTSSKELFPSLPGLDSPKSISSMVRSLRSWFESSYASSATSSGSVPQWMHTIKEIGFVFPIPFEDPLLAERQVHACMCKARRCKVNALINLSYMWYWNSC